MRSYNNLYEPMLEEKCIAECFYKAAEKKKDRKDVRKVLSNLDEHVRILKEILSEERFIPSSHEVSIVNENSVKKTRRIIKPYYKYEQVVHHCVVRQLQGIVTAGLSDFSCGSIPRRGVHYGKKYVRKWIDSYNGKKFYILKMDVRHFFETIDRRCLKEKLRAVIRDNRFYRLLCVLIECDKIANIIKKIEESEIRISEERKQEVVTQIAFDDLEGVARTLSECGFSQEFVESVCEIIERIREGVPLGYVTSQWFGNFSLKKLDHEIEQDKDVDHYIRYMDDMVVFGRSKKKLHKIRKNTEKHLQTLGLQLKGDWQAFRFEYPVFENGVPVIGKDGEQVTRGRALDFLGFQFHYNRTTIRKSCLKRARRKANHIAKKDNISWYNSAAMLSYMGAFKHADAYGYYENYVKPKIKIKTLKRIVSKHSRKEREKREELENSIWKSGREAVRGGQGVVANNCVLA